MRRIPQCLTNSGQVYTCGSGAFYQTGHGIRTSLAVPTRLDMFGSEKSIRIKKVMCGYAFTMFLTPEGTLYGCGYNQNGRIGISDDHSQIEDGMVLVRTPTRVDAAAGVTVRDMACGSGHTLLLLSDKTVIAFGRNDLGQVGSESRRGDVMEAFSIRAPHNSSHWQPQRLPLSNIAQVLTDGYVSFAISESNSVFFWGNHVMPVPVPAKARRRIPPGVAVRCDGDQLYSCNENHERLLIPCMGLENIFPQDSDAVDRLHSTRHNLSMFISPQGDLWLSGTSDEGFPAQWFGVQEGGHMCFAKAPEMESFHVASVTSGNEHLLALVLQDRSSTFESV